VDFGFKATKVVRVCGTDKMSFNDKTQAFCDKSKSVL